MIDVNVADLEEDDRFVRKGGDGVTKESVIAKVGAGVGEWVHRATRSLCL